VFGVARDDLGRARELALAGQHAGKRGASVVRVPEGAQRRRGVEWQSHGVLMDIVKVDGPV